MHSNCKKQGHQSASVYCVGCPLKPHDKRLGRNLYAMDNRNKDLEPSCAKHRGDLSTIQLKRREDCEPEGLPLPHFASLKLHIAWKGGGGQQGFVRGG
jgi:hypothetical protein